MDTNISKELDIISKAFQEDPDFARAWHDNIAMAVMDSIPDDRACFITRRNWANEAAARFMKNAFNTDTSWAGTAKIGLEDENPATEVLSGEMSATKKELFENT